MLDHRRYLELALAQAKIALSEGSTPVGGVLVDADGEVVAVSRNQSAPLGDPTAHAEMQAIRAGGRPDAALAGAGARSPGLHALHDRRALPDVRRPVLLSPIDTLVWAPVRSCSAVRRGTRSRARAGMRRASRRSPWSATGPRDPPAEPEAAVRVPHGPRRPRPRRNRPRRSRCPGLMVRIGVLTPSSNTRL